ncbi:MAG: cation:proton antiporter regulatory subunit [Thalassobaculum sp.]
MVTLRARYGINLLAIARSGAPIRSRLRDARFQAGDVLLLQGARDQINETVRALGCLPLAYRNLSLEPRRAPGAGPAVRRRHRRDRDQCPAGGRGARPSPWSCWSSCAASPCARSTRRSTGR